MLHLIRELSDELGNTIRNHKLDSLSLLQPTRSRLLHWYLSTSCPNHQTARPGVDLKLVRTRLTCCAQINPFEWRVSRRSGQSYIGQYHLSLLLNIAV